jgi:hypothetical protein
VRRGWQRGSGEEKRITEVIEVVPAAARRARIKAAVVIAGGGVAIGGVIFLGSLRKPKRGPFPAVPALGARLAAPALGETTPPAGEPAAEGAIGGPTNRHGREVLRSPRRPARRVPGGGCSARCCEGP